MRKLKKSEYVLAAFLFLVALFPLATAMNGVFLDFSPLASLTARDKIEIQEDIRAQRRIHSAYRALCNEKSAEDPDFVCPDVNNAYQVQKFLRNEPVETGSGSQASERIKSMLSIFDLNDHQRSLLRRFQRVQKCPEALDEILPGFFNLCRSQLIKGPNLLRGILNDRATLEESQNLKTPTTNDRLEMFKGSRPDR